MKSKTIFTSMLVLLLSSNIRSQTVELGVHWGNAVNGTALSDFMTTVTNLNPNKEKWIRTEISWADIQTSSNTFNWFQLPTRIQTLTDSGYSIIAILKNTPTWYTTNPDTTNFPQLNPYYAPLDTIEWVKFVDSVVTKFQNQIKYWEIWNEPDGGFFQSVTPLQKYKQFKNVLASGYRTIKNIDPSAKVLVGGFTTKVMSIPARKLFLDSLFAVNFQQYFDIMNIHVYELAYELKDIVTTMQNNGIGNYPIWITETNPWRELDPNNSETNTANYLCNWINDTLLSYFNPQVICWFNLRNFVPSIPAVCDTCDPNLTAFGLLNSLYQPTLVLAAYENCILNSLETPEHRSNRGITIYPNPFSLETTINVSTILENATLTIYDVFGNEVQVINNINGDKIAFYRNNLANGIYFIRLIQDEKNILNGKVLISD